MTAGVAERGGRPTPAHDGPSDARRTGWTGPGAPRRWLRRLRRAAALGIVLSAVLFALLWFLFPFPADRLDGFSAGEIYTDREGRILRAFASSRGEFRFPVPADRMSPWLLMATVAVEDRRFYSHPGVDPLAIGRALAQNAARGRVHSGASTLTQQIVRMMEERPRTLLSKAVEAFRALQLEGERTKDEILQAYLNLAPYGGNLRGVEAASLRYFGKRCRDLSLAEAALLAGLPQSPSRLRPDRHYERALERREVVLEAMVRAGYIRPERRDAALRERPAVRLHPWPFRAPHFTELARSLAGAGRGSASVRVEVRTTLDARLQAMAEARVAQLFAAEGRSSSVTSAGLPASGLPHSGRLSAGVVVLSAAGGEVRALVGSPDYGSLERLGAIDVCRRRRSPGSALKPFIYALALDRGLAGIDGYLADVPLSYADYIPQNYDRRFHGPVPAGRALGLSLNVPAVRLQEALGTGTVLGALRAAGIGGLDRPAGHYGLQLALGGCEVTLLDLAGAYGTLVRLGRPRPWRVIEGATSASPAASPDEFPDESPADEGPPVLSPGACRLVLETLASEEHLRRAQPDRTGGSGPFVGYKTGTSFGLRDAWAVAFTTAHVVGVWVGDPRGRAVPGLSGAESALPTALAIAEEIARGDPAASHAQTFLAESALAVSPSSGPSAAASTIVAPTIVAPIMAAPSIAVHPVCSLTGRPAGPHCPGRVPGRFPAGAPLPPPCDVHREIRFDPVRGVEVCPACAAGRPFERRVVEVWPSEVELWLRRAGVVAVDHPRALPPHDPACSRAQVAGEGPRILYPPNGAEILLGGGRGSTGSPTGDRIRLSAAAPPGVSRLHWFIDGNHVAMAPPGAEVPWSLERGCHRLRCVDDRGRASSVEFVVR